MRAGFIISCFECCEEELLCNVLKFGNLLYREKIIGDLL